MEKTFVMPDEYELQRIRDFNTGEKKSGNWNPPSIEWFNDGRRNLDRYKDPDISYISGPSNLIVNPHTYELIASAVSDVAELLPLSFDDKVWYLLNVFNQVDALDKENSRYKIYSTGEVGWLIKPAFFPKKVPHNKLFKIPEDPAKIYFAEHHPDDSKNNFKNIVEKNNLFGIEFFSIWES
ncbi:MAG: hypothetical protein L3J98_06110 [Gammaproteobacteria bacterium]|nr:hypothetical protein [Gammaproteobacteria bacterium]MCF6259720.1 hypothetical protein [Gammaproteobacteria bacterium]